MFKTTTTMAPVEITITLDDELKQKIDKITEQQKHIDNLISLYDKKLLKSLDYVTASEALLKEKMIALDEKIDQYQHVTRKIETTSREIIANTDKYTITLHSVEDYLNEYHKIIHESPIRDYVDVYGEKILVTNHDAMKSPILASVLNSKHKTLDLIDPTTFKDILEIIREFPVSEEKFKNLIYCERIIKNMKKLKIDPEVYPFLSVRMYRGLTKALLSTQISYVVGESDDFDNVEQIAGSILTSTKIKNKSVYIAYQHGAGVPLINNTIYYTIPKITKLMGITKEFDCGCNKTAVHLHKYNNLIKEEKQTPHTGLYLWYKIDIVDVDGNPITC